MKIVIAPDSYKGSLTSQQAAETMQRAIQSASPVFDTLTKPMAEEEREHLMRFWLSLAGRRRFSIVQVL